MGIATRKLTEREIKVFTFLNELRKSGKTNMFGARPFVMKKFGLPEDEAGSLLSLWMKYFNKGNYSEIEIPV